MYEFILPDIGEGISEALLINWSVKAGDRVEEGDELATISTDKVDVELPSPRSGVVSELCWTPGDTIKVGSVFLRIDTSDAADTAPAAKPSKPKAEQKSKTPAAPATSSIVAAPSTRKRAQDLGVDLGAVTGTGPGGRIVLRDIESGATADGETHSSTRHETPNSVRKAMADHMARSVHTLAHSTMNFEARADAFLALLAKLGPKAQARDIRLTPTALFAKCAGSALTDHPRFNATIDEDKGDLILHESVNLSVALASERGLLVPVVNNINTMSLFAVARALSDITARGRDGALDPQDVRGGTFTLSNTGNMERATITSTRPIINAPQTAILWVSRITERPRVSEGKLEAGPMVSCSLSFDHRFIDGADAVAFVNDVAAHIESPEQALAAD